MSTVVTSIMLVSAVSILGSFVLSWTNATFASQRTNVANSANERVNFVRENFVIEDVWFFQNGTGKYAIVTVRNTGDVAIKLSYVYINGSQAWAAGKTINLGAIGTITVANNWGSGKPQSIWVETSRNTEVKQVWKA